MIRTNRVLAIVSLREVKVLDAACLSDTGFV
jgi:hypothetical protein